MKKTFYYHFMPNKAEEEVEIERRVPHQVTRTLVEINDLTPPQLVVDSNYPWQIRKPLSSSDIMTGKLMLSHGDMFDHVFRYWSLDTCNHVVMGGRYLVVLLDFTDEKAPRRYQSENIFVERGPNETYLLGWFDLIRNRIINCGDEIGLLWDTRSGAFHFKLLRRGGGAA